MAGILRIHCLASFLAAIFAVSVPAADESDSKAPAPIKEKKIDFRTDVVPILQQDCVDCHGPSLEMGELRLDQHKFALEDDGRGLVKPGHSGDSLLIQRLVDPKLGILMPPTFPFLPGEKAGLSEAKINILKAWIDQGAPWPEGVSLSSDATASSEDAQTKAIFAAIRAGDHAAVEKLLLKTKTLINVRDKHGSTPLIHAAVYDDAKMVELLLSQGADANAANDDGATALTRAAGDVEKVRLLLKAGAKIDVRTPMGRTPLLVAASYPGNVETVRLLLSHGAKIGDQDQFGETCVTSAAKRGDAELVKALVAAGADVSAGGRPPLFWAAEEGNVETLICLLEHGAGKKKEHLNLALGSAAARGPIEAVRLLLDHGAEANSPSMLAGYTPLMLAAYSENVSIQTVQLLLDKGANPKAKGKNGETPLSLARKHGNSAVVELLKRAGAVE